jgi:hypothetical protein
MSLFRGLGFRKDATRGTTPIEVRKSLAGLFSATGVMPGGPSPLLTGNADWTYTVHGPAWFVATRGPSDGVALYGNDGDTIIGTTGVGSTVPIAPGAGLSRIDIAWTRHQSAGENGDPATTVALASEPLFGVASGTAASSSPVAPVIPAGAIELGRNTMTSAATSTASAGNTITQSAAVAMVQGTYPRPPGGAVGPADVQTTNGATFTSTPEVVMNSVTFTAEAGRRYEARWDGSFSMTQTTDTAQVNLRYKAGATCDATGTKFGGNWVGNWSVSAPTIPLSVGGDFVAPTSGQYTISALGIRNTGSGIVTPIGNSAVLRRLAVKDIGV